MKKSDIQLHSEGMGRHANPAINVKVYGHFGPSAVDLVAQYACDNATAEKALEFTFEMARERFWEDAEEIVEEIFPGAQFYSEGRMGGWLVVHGLSDIETWDAIALAKWAKLAKWCKTEITWLCSAENVLEDIEANQWAKPGAERYNFIDGKGDALVCIADLKQQAIAAGFAPVVRK